MEDPQNPEKKEEIVDETSVSEEIQEDSFDPDLEDLDEFDDFDVDLDDEFDEGLDASLEDFDGDFDSEFDTEFDPQFEAPDANSEDVKSEAQAETDPGEKAEIAADVLEDDLSDFDAPIEDDFAIDSEFDDGFDEAPASPAPAEESKGKKSKSQKMPNIGGGGAKSKLFNLVVFAVFGIVALGIIYFQFLSGGDEPVQTAQVVPLPTTQQPTPNEQNQEVPARIASNEIDDLDSLLGIGDPAPTPVSSEEQPTQTVLANEDPFADFDDLPSPQPVNGSVDVPSEDLGLGEAPVIEQREANEPDFNELDDLVEDTVSEVVDMTPPEQTLQVEAEEDTYTSESLAQMPEASLAILEDIRAELKTLGTRVEGLEAKVRRNSDKIDSDSVDEGILSAIRSLEDKVTRLAEGRGLSSGNNVAPIKRTVDVEQPRAVPPRNTSSSSIVVRPIVNPAIPQPKPQVQNTGSRTTASAPRTLGQIQSPWVLRAAQPGKAWLSQAGSQEIVAVSVGDVFEPYGKIMFIGRGQNGWVVQGAKATLSQ